MLENQLYMGGFYNNVTASDLIADVLGQIPYELDSNIGNLVMNGYMKAQTKREALRQKKYKNPKRVFSIICIFTRFLMSFSNIFSRTSCVYFLFSSKVSKSAYLKTKLF